MGTAQSKRLTGRELHDLFDQLFPHGFAGADLLAGIARDGWEHSALLACFHPSVEGDHLRFHLGTIWISRRTDMTHVYAMIFRRLKALSADWVYRFPELGLCRIGAARRRG